MGFLKVDYHHVGQGAGTQHAQLAVGTPHGPGAVDGRQPQRLVSRKRQRIARGGLLQECRRTQFLEHVQIVVRARAVGSHGHERPALEHPLHGRYTAGNLHVALRIVGNGHTAPRQNVDILVVDPYAMGTDRPLVEEADRIEILDGRTSEVFAHDAHLVLRLGHMDHAVQPQAVGQCLAAQQILLRDRIGRMRRHRQPDARPPRSGEIPRRCSYRNNCNRAWPGCPGGRPPRHSGFRNNTCRRTT